MGQTSTSHASTATNGWSEPEHLACRPTGPNSPLDEQGPSYVRKHGAGGPLLLVRPRHLRERPDWRTGASVRPTPVAELNTASSDIQPNVRKDGLEIVFDSNRSDTLGGQDLYSATRESIDDPWSTPVILGTGREHDEQRDAGIVLGAAQTLYFGRAPGPEGSTDIYVTTRHSHGGH